MQTDERSQGLPARLALGCPVGPGSQEPPRQLCPTRTVSTEPLPSFCRCGTGVRASRRCPCDQGDKASGCVSERLRWQDHTCCCIFMALREPWWRDRAQGSLHGDPSDSACAPPPYCVLTLPKYRARTLRCEYSYRPGPVRASREPTNGPDTGPPGSAVLKL